MPERIVIRNTQSPGDYVVLSAAIRDLQRAHPGRFELMMDVPQPAVFLHSPYIRGFGKSSAGVRQIVGQYPAIHTSNQRKGIHFMWGFIEDLNQKLKTNAILTDFRPDLHLTEEEKKQPPLGLQKPYWVFASGGKKDFTAKWWHPQCWQEVVDRMTARGHHMVQVGGGSHIHPPVKHALDLVGKTSFRELMCLIYHAEGVMCIVTCLMHIAAAFNKPCVVVAGGREPWWWEAYTAENRLTNMCKGQPGWTPPADDNFIPHQYLHTIGELDCCKGGGCWLSRIEGQGSVCKKPVVVAGRAIPKCLQMITPEIVVQAAETYYESGMIGRSTGGLILPSIPIPQQVDQALHMAVGTTTEELQRAFNDHTTRWLIWSHPNSEHLPATDWVDQALGRVETSRAAVGGLLSWRYLDQASAEQVNRFLPTPLIAHPLTPGRFKAHMLTGGLMVLDKSRAAELSIPPETPAEWLDVVLAETLLRRKHRIADLTDLVRYL